MLLKEIVLLLNYLKCKTFVANNPIGCCIKKSTTAKVFDLN